MNPSDARAFLQTLQNYLGPYHNHKEAMTYTAVALYLAAAVTLVANEELFKTLLSGPTLVSTLAIVGLASSFVDWQLRRRRWAANMVWVCDALIARTLTRIGSPGSDLDIVNEANWEPPSGDKEIRALEGNRYPRIMAAQLEKKPDLGLDVIESLTLGSMAAVTLMAMWKANDLMTWHPELVAPTFGAGLGILMVFAGLVCRSVNARMLFIVRVVLFIGGVTLAGLSGILSSASPNNLCPPI